MAEKKEKRYVSDNAQLMAKWNWEKNNAIGVFPQKLTCGSGKKAWWKCNEGHEWESTVNNINNGNGCPYCSRKYPINGENDLQTVNPILANEWNHLLNHGLTPMDVLPNSNKKVWWKCSKGHEWQATVADRNNGNGCPYCSGKYPIKGENDLQTVNPNLANEWNHLLNHGLTPMDVLPNSNKKVWWKCSKGHEWQATINHRNNGRSCPCCNLERNTSFPEYAIVYYLKKHNLDVMHSYKERGYELDVFIPSKKIAVEYDGYYWHRNKLKQDLEKNINCQKDNIKLYRIREGLPSLNSSSIDYVIEEGKQSDLSRVLAIVLREIIETNVDVNLERDAINIENLRLFVEKTNSLSSLNSQIANEWNFARNGNLKPEFVASNSSKKVWWKCGKGHEWQATISSRSEGKGCPYCSGRIAIKGKNDLKTINPDLANEWNHEKNNDLTPSDVKPNSHNMVWWKCNKGHEWQATIASRYKGNGCPICSNQKILVGYNDLPTINPLLTQEWNFEKNFGLKPENFTANSGKKVWWICSKNHEWQARIQDRNRGRGCPECAKEKRKKSK